MWGESRTNEPSEEDCATKLSCSGTTKTGTMATLAPWAEANPAPYTKRVPKHLRLTPADEL